MPWLLNVGYLLALLVLSPYLLYRAFRTRRYLGSLGTRFFGRVPAGIPTGAVWFHGVSVGEVHLLRQVIGAFRQRFPQLPVVVSSTTDTGLSEARKAFADLPVIVFPLDFSWAVSHALARLRPALVVLAEGELWPNFLLACRRATVPVAIINARMSPRSFGRYRTLGWIGRRLLNLPDRWIVQHETFELNLTTLGVPHERVCVSGSVKFDGAVGARDNPRTAALRELFGLQEGELVLVVGSTQAPEEEIALRVWQSLSAADRPIRLILVPRQKERFDEVARMLERAGVPCTRRTQMTPGSQDAVANVILVDTIGELRAVWGLADLAFVGGSLDGQRGGQNMLEPAGYGTAVVFGPHVWNFAAIAGNLLDVRGAVQVRDEVELLATVTRLLADPAERERLGRAGRRFVEMQQGATQRTIEVLAGLLAEQANKKAA
jgi:3-deoxy-D-manno-octulosonic-acid transferase